MKKTWELAKPTFLIAAVLLAGFASPSKSLAQNPPGTTSPYATLININFGAHQSPGLDGIKVGLAATGQSANDFWNFYSRDDGQGDWQVDGALPNLKLADGSVSSAGLIVSNAPGCWSDGSTDSMYNTYVYPFDSGNTTVVVTNLVAGQYDFYVYGPNGKYQLTVGATGYGTKTSYDSPVSNPPVWQEGRQYALFRGVSVEAGRAVTITVLPAVGGYVSISGMQIGMATFVPAAEGTLINVNFGASQSPWLAGIKVGLAATGLTTNDFWNFYSRDDSQGNWQVNGALPNLKLADGSVSAAGLIVSNAPGCWGDGSTDSMYNSYIYPLDGGNTTVMVTNLAAGEYDFYVYSPNGKYQLGVGATGYGTKTSYDSPVINPPVWQEGRQYALFRGVPVRVGQAVTITALPAVGGYVSLSGIQICSTKVATGLWPRIVTQPQSQTVRVGSDVTFMVTALGIGRLNYQWRLGGTNLAGATGSALVVENVQVINAGNYSVRVSSAFGSITSSNATLTVIPATAGALINVNFGASQSPWLAGVKVGLAATGLTANDFWNFYSRDDGQGNWRVDGALPNLKFVDGSVSGAGLIVRNAPGCWGDGSTDPMYNSYVYPLDGGNTTVMVTNLAAGQYDFYLYSPNGKFGLQVGATGYGIKTSYDSPLSNPPVWQEGRQYVLFRGVSVGAGQAVAVTVLPAAGGYESVCGIQISSTTVVTGTAPSILTQPQSQAVGVGSNATFTVTATGTAPLSYQWRLNGVNLAGATDSALVLEDVRPNNAGSFSVQVSNPYGSVLSSNATLTVVSGVPGSLIDVNFGADQSPWLAGIKVGLAATGLTASDFWNFYSRDDGQGNWRVDGALPNLKFADGSVSGAGLIVSNAPGCWGDGSTDPMYNSYVYPLDGGNTTVMVTNLAAGQYDFYLYSPNGKFELQVGATGGAGIKTSSDSPLSNPPVWQEGRQYVLFRGVSVGAGQAVAVTVLPAAGGYESVCGMQISSTTVATGTAPSILTQPQSQTVGVGSNVTFTVTATGTAPLSYQWRLGGMNLAGATGSALVQANVQPADTGSYSVQVSNLYGSVLSSNATLTVIQTAPNTLINVDFGAGPASSGSPKTGPAAVGQATTDFWNFYTRDDAAGGWRTFGVLSGLKFANGTVSSGGMTVLNAPGEWADGSSDPMYNAYIYPFDGGNVTVTVTNLAAGQYDFYVYGFDGNYQLTVGPIDYGARTTLDVPVVNPPVWQEGRQYALYRGVSVGAAQGVTLTVQPGVYGYAVISGMQIKSATVVVGIPPSIVTQPRSQTVGVGSNVTFTVTAAGTAPLSYQWRLGETNLAGATGSSLLLQDVQPAVAGNYSVRVANAFGSVLSSNATLTVAQGAANTLINVDFGAGPAASGSPKVGPAATGQMTNDYWNFYTRDDDSGGWRTFGVLSNLKFANGVASSGGMTVLNAPGEWSAGSSDPMYDSYIYSLDGGNVTITVTNLSAGHYDFYLYDPNANFQLQVGGTNYGAKASLDIPVSNPPVWQEGRQYALFRGVSVGVGQAVTITVLPAVGGYFSISGMQIVSAGAVGRLQKQTSQLKVSSVPSGTAGSQIQLELLGAPNQVYVIQATTNLTDWVTIGICATDANGDVKLTDPDAQKYPARLYRVVGQ